jgi:hypothetical protein
LHSRERMVQDADAPYVPVSVGQIAETRDYGPIEADFDDNGRLLGILILNPCGPRLLHRILEGERPPPD